MGYSIDTKSNQTVVNGTSINASVASATGTHTLYVTASGKGVSCVDSLTLYVSAPLPPGPVIPGNAVVVKSIQDLSTWQAAFDTGTGSGSASGVMGLVSTPSLSGSALMFETSYSDYGGERYSVGLRLRYGFRELCLRYMGLSRRSNLGNRQYRDGPEPGSGQRGHRDLRIPVRRLVRDLGLHGERRHSFRSRCRVAALDRKPAIRRRGRPTRGITSRSALHAMAAATSPTSRSGWMARSRPKRYGQLRFHAGMGFRVLTQLPGGRLYFDGRIVDDLRG